MLQAVTTNKFHSQDIVTNFAFFQFSGPQFFLLRKFSDSGNNLHCPVATLASNERNTSCVTSDVYSNGLLSVSTVCALNVYNGKWT